MASLGNGQPIVADALAGGQPVAHAEQLGLGLALEPAAPRIGRPPGRRNYRTEQLIAYLQSKGKLPAELLSDVGRRGWRWLAKELQISREEGFKHWLAIQQALLPYTAARLAQLEVHSTGEGSLGAGALHLLAAQTMAAQLAGGAPFYQNGAAPEPIVNAELFAAIPSEIPGGRPLE